MRALEPGRLRRAARAACCTPSVGAHESEEFLRQNELIRERWGAAAVPVCETIAGTNHFTCCTSWPTRSGRLHQLALQLLRPALTTIALHS